MACQDEKDKERTRCPYCDVEIMKASFPFCQSCKVTVVYCPKCRQIVERDSRVCPHCGTAIKSQDKN